jgi:gas vesicle protein
MENKRNHFIDGLLLGTVVGGAAFFLLGTKKGREILKIVKEEGRERFGSFDDIIKDCKELVGGDMAKNVEKVKDKVVAKIEEEAKPVRRKLFKGLSKKK